VSHNRSVTQAPDLKVDDVFMAGSVPLLRHPYWLPSAFTPEALVRAVRAERGIGFEKLPSVCVLDFDGDLTDWLIDKKLVSRCTYWACFHTSMYVIKVDGNDCGIIPRTIGGPYAVLVAEQLRISGAEVVIGLASAGRVLDSLPLPSLIIATSAVRDEGTSYHYLPPEETIHTSDGIAESLETELCDLDLPVKRGCVWTTDAPYRETREQLQHYASKGVLAVEMQAASLFAFAEARKASVGMVAQVTNATHDGCESFEKGPEDFNLRLLERICRAAVRHARQTRSALNAS
jgi:uridine phosphorylase